ncbi:MAG: hypothetical protein K0S79_58 [Nitrospira sp.]|jgi:hypothetical protein|nr:hypothetical protein [Nitrospira sp.]
MKLKQNKVKLVGFNADDTELRKIEQAVKRNGGIPQAAILRMAFHDWDIRDKARHHNQKGEM